MENKILKRINTKSVLQSVIDVITDSIISGELKKGDQLPSEPDLVEMLGVGRSSIREAIKILVYLGVLETRRSEGTFVSDGFNESMINPLVYGVFLVEGDSLEHLIEVRQMIEVGIVRLAIINKDENTLPSLKDKLDAMEEAVKKSSKDKLFDNLFEADDQFHHALTLTCKNPIADKLNHIVRSLTFSVRRDTVEMMINQGRVNELIDAHWDIYNLIKDGDIHNLDASIVDTYFLDDFYKTKGIEKKNE